MAIKQYNYAIDHKRILTWAYERRAHAYQKTGNVKQALADYQKSIDIDPLNDGSARCKRAQLLMSTGRLKEALADINIAIAPKRFPNSFPAPAWYLETRAEIYLAMNKPKEAIADFTYVINSDGADISTYFNRGKAYESLGSYKLARADYRRSLKEPARNRVERKLHHHARIRLKPLSHWR